MFHNKSKNSNGTEMINVTKHPAYSFNVSTMVKKLSVCVCVSFLIKDIATNDKQGHCRGKTAVQKCVSRCYGKMFDLIGAFFGPHE